MIEFSFLASFTKSVKRLRKKYRSLEGDIDQLLEELQTNPYLGTDLGDNVRKIRLGIASKGKGKRGGARVLTDTEAVVSIDEGRVTFMTSRNGRHSLMQKSRNWSTCPAITNNSFINNEAVPWGRLFLFLIPA